MNTLNSFLDYCKNKNIKLTEAQIVASKALFDIPTGCGKTTLTSLLYDFDIAPKVTFENITKHDEYLTIQIEAHNKPSDCTPCAPTLYPKGSGRRCALCGEEYDDYESHVIRCTCG